MAASSAGQSVLSSIGVSADLNCSAESTQYDSHPGIFYDDTACGTFLWVNGVVYGPASIPAGFSPTPWTPISQQTTGTGTSASPFVTTTQVGAGDTGVTLTETDTFVTGSRSWTTSVSIANPGAATVDRLSRGEDCYAAASDFGNGQFDPATKTTYCEGATAAIGLTPQTAGATYLEDFYATIWSMVSTDQDLPDTIHAAQIDNGQAISWNLSGSHATSWSWRTTLLVGPSASDQGTTPNGAERPTTCSTSRPVNCATGDFWHTFTDFDIPDHGLSFQFTRTYDAANAATAGPLGFGWTDSFNMSLLADSGSATVTQENGSQVTFTSNGDGTWSAPARVLATLTSNPDGSMTFTRNSDHVAYKFDSAGRLMTATDRNGNALTFGYTGGNLTSVTDGAGRQVTLTYDGSGHLARISDPMGRTTTFTYDGHGDLATSADPLGKTWTFSYDANHQLLSYTDPRGGTTTNTYDNQGRVISQVQPDGKTVTLSYDGDPGSSTGSTTTLTDTRGDQTIYTYANMLLLSVQRGAGTSGATTTSYTYDILTLGVATRTDGEGNVWQATYDINGNRTGSADPLGNTTSYTYNGLDEITTISSPLGETKTNSYDSDGNLTKTVDPLGNATTYTYGDTAHRDEITAMTDAGGRVTTFGYDSNGDVTSEARHPDAATTDTTLYGYDADGERTCVVSANAQAAGAGCPAAGAAPAAGVSTLSYNAGGQLTAIRDGAGGVTGYGYDADGDRTKVTDPDGHSTVTAYDADGRVTSVTTGADGAAPSTISTGYDLPAGSGFCAGNSGASYCTTTTDPDGHVTVDYYNALDQPIEEARPGGHVTSYTYDAAGNRATKTDSSGAVTSYGYDAAGELSTISYSNGATPEVSYSYDGDGHRTSMTDGTGTSSYTYDAAGRLTSRQAGAGSTVGYQYDGSGRITELTYPNAKTVKRSYDGAGRLISVTDWNGHTTTFSYDPDGDVSKTGYPDGDEVDSAYNPAQQLVSTGAVRSSDRSVLVGLTYTRDAGQITRESASGALSGTASYGYNAQSQLTQVNSTGYGYDAAGNPTQLGPAAQTFDTADELTASTGGSGTTPYSYDADGNRTGLTAADGSAASYSYDQAGRLTSVATTPPTTPAPVVTSVSPSSGPAGGGTTVTITGQDFTGATTVHFGGSPARQFTVAAPGTIKAVSPAGHGTVNISVTTPAGTSTASAADQFSYAGAPVVTAVAPSHGRTSGGTKVRISGANFAGATAVRFGHQAARFTITSAKVISARSPAGRGIVNVTVTTPAGTSAVAAADRFSYIGAPAVTGVTPRHGPAAGGTKVAIRGTRFLGVTAVRFGHRVARFTVTSATVISARSPAGTGTVNITVTTLSGTSKTNSSDRFTYRHRRSRTGLAAAAAAGTTVASYTYDGDGLLASETTATGRATFAWDITSADPRLLNDGTNSYIYGPTGAVIEQISGSDVSSYYFTDALGSTRALLTGAGGVGAAFSYNAYGQLTGHTGTSQTPVLFAGGYSDSPTGLYYLLNRYYDPGTAQFLTVDPALDASMTAYTYASDNPVNEFDPNGLLSLSTALGWAGLGLATAGLIVATPFIPEVTLPLGFSLAEGIGVAGVVVGVASTAVDCHDHGFISPQCGVDAAGVVVGGFGVAFDEFHPLIVGAIGEGLSVTGLLLPDGEVNDGASSGQLGPCASPSLTAASSSAQLLQPAFGGIQ